MGFLVGQMHYCYRTFLIEKKRVRIGTDTTSDWVTEESVQIRGTNDLRAMSRHGESHRGLNR
jgi:hypothetical protein